MTAVLAGVPVGVCRLCHQSYMYCSCALWEKCRDAARWTPSMGRPGPPAVPVSIPPQPKKDGQP